MRDSFAWKNGQAGFALGTFNEAPGGSPPVLGYGLPDVVDATLPNLTAWENAGYGTYCVVRSALSRDGAGAPYTPR